MKYLHKRCALIVGGMAIVGLTYAGGMNDMAAHSLGEFDRVGVNQPKPRAQQGEVAKAQKKSVSDTDRSAQKAEFLRRLFWIALVAR